MFLSHFIDFQLRRSLQHLIIQVTDRCNMQCGHCFVTGRDGAELSLENYRKLGREAGKLLWLDVAGGEPFLRSDLPEIVASFDAEVVQIPTNGSMTEEVVAGVRRIREKSLAQVAVSVSIDDFPEEHDRLRCQAGSWERAWQTFEALRALKVPVKINTVLTSNNLTRMPELMTHVRQRNPDFHSVIFHRGISRDPSIRVPEVAELKRLAPRALQILGSYDYGRRGWTARILRNYHRLLWATSIRVLEEGMQVVPCLAGAAQLVVYADGGVAPCELLPAIGNVREESLADILMGESLRRQRATIAANGCHCTHNCALLDSILFRPGSIFPLLYHPSTSSQEAA
ncbi:radical SAM protein [Geomobilimonas luticola]|uniref:Radical SAM protein n=1 Tax=Geomobilimonas luticola TaxID=1114878 RepID=A0ABS5SAT7_9BACT|nr:radical SAM protein [Geomobilimonas luticola]MBT0652295.1 radical SAM protein [Geomobilimonas luticola]